MNRDRESQSNQSQSEVRRSRLTPANAVRVALLTTLLGGAVAMASRIQVQDEKSLASNAWPTPTRDDGSLKVEWGPVATSTAIPTKASAIRVVRIGGNLPSTRNGFDWTSPDTYIGRDYLCTSIRAEKSGGRGVGLASFLPEWLRSKIGIERQRQLVDCLKASSILGSLFEKDLGTPLDQLKPENITGEDKVESIADDVVEAAENTITQEAVEKALGLRGGTTVWSAREDNQLKQTDAVIIEGTNPGRGQVSKKEGAFVVKIKNKVVVFLLRCKNPFLNIFEIVKKPEQPKQPEQPTILPQPPVEKTPTPRPTIKPQPPQATATPGLGPTDTPQPVATRIPTETPSSAVQTPVSVSTPRATTAPSGN